MRIGVDLGGTKIEALVIASDGAELRRIRVKTPKNDYRATILAIRDIVGVISDGISREVLPVGVAIPGVISPATGLIKNANTTCLIGKPFNEDLSLVLGCEVRSANDANCFVLSEFCDGAASGAKSVFGAIIGTGVGAGLIIDGHLHEGENCVAGEWGHTPLPWPEDQELAGPDCYCGKRGCIETFLSGSGLSYTYKTMSGREFNASEISTLASDGNAVAEKCVQRYQRQMAKSLAMVITIIDPAIIVLGGGLSNISSLYSRVPELWGEFAFSDQISTKLVKAKHGDSSGVRGAAWLWPVSSNSYL